MKTNNTFKSGDWKSIPGTNDDEMEGSTRAEKDSLDALKDPDGLPTVAIETIPGGPWSCAQMHVFGVDIARVSG